MKTSSKVLPLLTLSFALAVTSCTNDDNTHHCTGAQGESVDISWKKFSASAIVTHQDGTQIEYGSVNQKHLAKAYIRPLGGSCANWNPQ